MIRSDIFKYLSYSVTDNIILRVQDFITANNEKEITPVEIPSSVFNNSNHFAVDFSCVFLRIIVLVKTIIFHIRTFKRKHPEHQP